MRSVWVSAALHCALSEAWDCTSVTREILKLIFGWFSVGGGVLGLCQQFARQLTITMSLKSAKSINGEAAKRRQAIRAESPDCNEITRLS